MPKMDAKTALLALVALVMPSLALADKADRFDVEFLHERLDQIEEQNRALTDLVNQLITENAEIKSTLAQKLKAQPVVASETESDTSTGDKVLYEKAAKRYADKQYLKASEIFSALIDNHPDSSYVADSYYWKGDALFKLGKHKAARDILKDMLIAYPDSEKYPNALFKLGLVSRKIGEEKDAERYMNLLIKHFPNHDYAKLAKDFLKKEE